MANSLQGAALATISHHTWTVLGRCRKGGARDTEKIRKALYGGAKAPPFQTRSENLGQSRGSWEAA